MNIERGKFIVLEGIDRSGKSTQAALLHAKIKDSILISFPNLENKTGKLIKELEETRTDNAELYAATFSLNRLEEQEKIRTALYAGKTVICDRYIASGLAYARASGIHDTARYEYALINPDITIYIELYPEIARFRAEYGLGVNEDLEFQQKVFDEYAKLKDRMQFFIIGGNKDIKSIHEEIINEIGKSKPYPLLRYFGYL